jgi:hypothetical protein
MRKLDKTLGLASEYHKWLEAEQHKNPTERKEYDGNAAQFKYYKDVVMELLHCQLGLCAYTEQLLCPSEYIDLIHWQKGKYNRQLLEKKFFNGELDHFDESLKRVNAWLWDNFFFVDSDTNNRKGTRPVDARLKPDSPAYNPFEWLDYSVQTHRFVINQAKDLTDEDRAHLQHIVDDVLGINFSTVVEKRRIEMTKRKKMIEFAIELTADDLREFPTAFEFCKQLLKG